MIPLHPWRPANSLSTAALVLMLLAGCQRYAPKPLDLPAHSRAFLDRIPEVPPASEFAASVTPAGTPSAESSLPAGTQSLTLAQAQAVAMIFNSQLRLARLNAGVARAAADTAGLWDDPTIGVDLTRIIQSVPNPWKLASTLGITLPVSGRLEALRKEADARHQAQLVRVAADEWHTRLEVHRAWNRHAALELQHRAVQEHIARSGEVLAIVARMEQAGEIGRTEARLFRIELAGELAQQARISAQLQSSNLALRGLIGLAPHAPIHLAASHITPGPDHAARPLPALIEQAQSSNQSLHIARADYEIAERELALAIRQQYPDLQLGPGIGREDGNDQVLLSAAIPLPLLNANRQGIAKATAAREVAFEQANAALEQLIADLANAQLALDTATKERTHLESNLLPLIDAQYADARALAALGEINTLILLESLKRQHEAKLAIINAALNETLAALDIEELLGPIPPTQPTPPAAAD